MKWSDIVCFRSATFRRLNRICDVNCIKEATLFGQWQMQYALFLVLRLLTLANTKLNIYNKNSLIIFYDLHTQLL